MKDHIQYRSSHHHSEVVNQIKTGIVVVVVPHLPSRGAQRSIKTSRATLNVDGARFGYSRRHDSICATRNTRACMASVHSRRKLRGEY